VIPEDSRLECRLGYGRYGSGVSSRDDSREATAFGQPPSPVVIPAKMRALGIRRE
jgi:hypothetical protein